MKILYIPLVATVFAISACSQAASGTGQTVDESTQLEDTVAVPQFDADSAYDRVAEQVAMGYRTPGSEGHSRCRQYIVDRLKAYGADSVSLQNGSVKTWDGNTVPATNIMASFNSRAPRRILLAAHYDTRPWADEDNSDANHSQPIAGANDGASGVGVLLEIARLVGQTAPQVGVDMLFTDVEDSGAHGGDDEDSADSDSWCLGSQYWAKNNPYTATTRPAFGILLDMVGGKDARFYREYFSDYNAANINTKVWNAARRLGIDRFVNERRGAVTDDHIYISRAGIPCIDIIECANSETGSFPPYWHTTGDTMDIIDRGTLCDVGRTVTYVIYSEKAN